MKDFVDLILSYPIWVRVAVLLLEAAVFGLLIFGRGAQPTVPDKTGGQAKLEPATPAPKREDAQATRIHDKSRPALLVSFTDMTRGTVELSIQVQPIPEKVPLLVANFGGLEPAQTAAIAFIEGKIRDRLVSLTSTEARRRRAVLAEEIKESTKDVLAEKYYLTIYAVILGEIRTVDGATQPAKGAQKAAGRH